MLSRAVSGKRFVLSRNSILSSLKGFFLSFVLSLFCSFNPFFFSSLSFCSEGKEESKKEIFWEGGSEDQVEGAGEEQEGYYVAVDDYWASKPSILSFLKEDMILVSNFIGTQVWLSN